MASPACPGGHGAGADRGRAGRAALILALATALAAVPAAAQFNGRFEIEPLRLADENFLDWKAYQSLPSWQYAWYAAPNGLRATVGSLSQEEFYQAVEIKLEADLGAYASFLYSQREESVFRPEPLYQEAEMRFGTGWYASIIGFPQHDKIRVSQGAALAYGKRTDATFVRYSHLDQNALFNQKNTQPERFQPAPMMDRVEVRIVRPEGVFLNVDIRQEHPTTLLSPAAPEVRKYRGDKNEGTLDWLGLGGGRVLGVAWQDNREERAQIPAAPSTQVPELYQLLEWRWLDLYTAFPWGESDRLTLGVLRGGFHDRIQASLAEREFRNRLVTTLVYGLWERRIDERWQWLMTLQGGQAEFLLRDPTSPDPLVDTKTWETKLGVGVVLSRAGKFRFFFNSTWDLDLVDKRQWDGGNLQLQMFF